MDQSFARAAEHSRQALDLAERHGWTDEPCAGLACAVFADILAWQGRPQEAGPWLQRAERTMTTRADPAWRVAVACIRGRLELASGRDADALAAFRAAEQLARYLPAPHLLVTRTRAWLLAALVHQGGTEHAEQALADFGEHDRDSPEARTAAAALRLAQGNAAAATAALAPVLDGRDPAPAWTWLGHALLLEAIARDVLGDQAAACQALERALDLAEPNGALLWFLLHPAPGLLDRHARHRTAHAALITEILGQLAGSQAGRTHGAPSAAGPRPLAEPLSQSELRVLRYLPTNLTTPEIAGQLFVSPNTVKAHVRNLYAKLGAHRRSEAVTRARDLGLLAPSAHSTR